MNTCRSYLTLPILGLAALLVAACGGGGGSDRTPAETTAPPPAEPAPMPEPEPMPTPEPEPALEPPAPPPASTTDNRPPPTPEIEPAIERRGLTEAVAQARARSLPLLERTNPVPAWQRATGAGETIVVFDDGVDVRHSEFEGRIHPFTDVLYISTASEYRLCSLHPSCTTREADTLNDAEVDALAMVSVLGFPSSVEGSVFYRIGSPGNYVYREIPALAEQRLDDGRSKRGHGTAVASVALGRTLGVAPDASLYAISIPFAHEDGTTDIVSELSRLYTPEGGPELVYRFRRVMNPSDIDSYDRWFADWFETLSARAVVINRSYGIPSESEFALLANDDQRLPVWNWIANNLPNYMAALRDPDNAVVVTSAGNTQPGGEQLPLPDFSSSFAYFDTPLRGRFLAVVGVGSDGTIDDGSSKCGGLPDGWEASRDGRHYCLAAPFYAKVASPAVTGAGGVSSDYTATGTSFSAPMVAGAIALMAEQFRGQMTRRQLGLRVVNTANNRGIYADVATYGAGLLDLGAAHTGREHHYGAPWRSSGPERYAAHHPVRLGRSVGPPRLRRDRGLR